MKKTFFLFVILSLFSGVVYAQSDKWFSAVAGQGSGVRFFLDRFTIDSTKGINDTQDFTSSEVGYNVTGLFTLTSPFTSTGTNGGAAMGVGAADFSATDGSFVVVAASKDAVGTTVTLNDSTKTGALGSFKADASIEEYIGQTEGDGSGSNSGPIISGFRTQYKGFDPSVNALFDVILMGGSGLQYDVQLIEGGTDTSTGTTTFGFQADIVIFAAAHDSTNDARISIGFAQKPSSLEQGFVTYVDRNGVATSNNWSKTGNTAAVVLLAAATGANLRSLVVNDITSTGVEYTFGGNWTSGGGNKIRVIGIKVSNGNAWAGLIDSPTSAASDWTDNTPGFQPGALIIVQGPATALDTAYSGGAFGVSLIVGSKSAYTSVTMQDSLATSDTATELGAVNVSMLFKDHDKTTLHNIATISPTSTGWEALAADITTANGTARKWLAFAIEGAVAQ